ncbi:MAG: DinB family protein [Bacteroidota bacterium]
MDQTINSDNYRLIRPQEDECAPFYKGYIQNVVGNDFLKCLKESADSTLELMRNIPADRWDHRYAPDKWTVKDIFVHLMDSERIFVYRALRIARGDTTPLPGFEQDDYVLPAKTSRRSPASLMAEYSAVRAASISLFSNLDEEAMSARGTASGKACSVRAIGFIMAGHEIHHLNILNERYFEHV